MLARTKTMLRCTALYVRLMRATPDADLRRLYRRRMLAVWRRRHELESVFIYLIKAAMHQHYAAIIRDMSGAERHVVNTF
jgi:hypothetical protein